MAAKKSSPTFDFTKKFLEKKPAASFAEIQAAASKKGLKVIPVVYGRAKKLLGLAKPTAKKAAPSAGVAGKVAARRGRPPKSAAAIVTGTALGTLEGAIQAMRRNDMDRERYRRILERIRDLAAEALG